MRNKLTVRSFLCCLMLTGALSFGAPVLVCGSTEAAVTETAVQVCGSIVAAPGMTPGVEKCETEGSRSENEEVYGPPVPEAADNSGTGNVDATGTDSMAGEADGKSQLFGNRAEKVILLRNRMNRRAILYFRIQHLREAERRTKQIILERVRSADLPMKLLQGRMRKDL